MSNPTLSLNNHGLASTVAVPLKQVTYGTAFGSELISNGDFSSGTTGWTFGTNWSHIATSPVYARYTGAGAGGEKLEQNLSGITTAGTWYRLQFTIVAVTGLEWSVRVGASGYVTPLISSRTHIGEGAGTYTFDFEAPNNGSTFSPNNFYVQGYGNSGGHFYGVDDISLKECTTTATAYMQNMIRGEIVPSKGSYTAPTSNTPTKGWIG